jgi:hypothetical protein
MFYDLYSSNFNRPIKASRMRWMGHVLRVGERTGAFRVFVARPEGKRPLGKNRRRWEDNIKTDLKEIGFGGRELN